MDFDVTEVVSSPGSDRVLTRLWRNWQLMDVVDHGSDHRALYRVVSRWPDAASEEGYWNGVQPICRSIVSADGQTTEFDPVSWILAASPTEALPGASLSFSVAVSGYGIYPDLMIAQTVVLEDGMLGSETVTAVDLAISGRAQEIVPWVVGRLAFRDIAARLVVDGDIMLLGAVAGVLSMSGGFRFSDDSAIAAQLIADLVSAHRAISVGQRQTSPRESVSPDA